MNTMAPAQKTSASALASIYEPVANELADTTELLKERLRHLDPTFDRYLKYSFKLGGKRLRPVLVLLCSQAAGKIDDRSRLVAAALEMIHTGSLVHDDILDGAKFRRQFQTINAKWDSQRAVLIGDLLIARAIELVCECEDFYVFNKVAACCQRTVEGELYQTESVGNLHLTRDDYLKIIGGKTASLIECAAVLGAYLGGAPKAELDKYARVGQSLGVAFQIVDDVLDLVGDEEKLGKTLGTDLENKKETLPLIVYFENATDEDRAKMHKRIDSGVKAEDRAEVAAILKESGAVDEAIGEAKKLVEEALAIIAGLRETAENDDREDALAALDSLAQLARFVVKRDK